MNGDRRVISGRCALWAASAFVSFVGAEFLASASGLPEWARVGLALAGYISLILLLSCALRAWRDDWSALWLLPKNERPRRADRSPGRAALIFQARRRSDLAARH